MCEIPVSQFEEECSMLGNPCKISTTNLFNFFGKRQMMIFLVCVALIKQKMGIKISTNRVKSIAASQFFAQKQIQGSQLYFERLFILQFCQGVLRVNL